MLYVNINDNRYLFHKREQEQCSAGTLCIVQARSRLTSMLKLSLIRALIHRHNQCVLLATVSQLLNLDDCCFIKEVMF